jgi:cellulose synthase/poly-beta-1,6-N-acetylglucosamine synthase-like glycosyltransferase
MRTAAEVLFVFSVVSIWLMLLYQFVLTIGGFLWRVIWLRSERRAVPPDEWPGVSILIPARNEEKVILGLLDHLLAMDYPRDRMEIIVINDGSTDGTADLVRRVRKTDPLLRLENIPAEEGGRGKSAVLNRGLALASHGLIAVYDADNRPEPGSLKILCRALMADPRLAAVTGKFRAYNKERTLLTRLVNIESIAFQWIIQAGRWFFLRVAFLPGTNFVIRKDVLEKIGGWDENALTEDSELTFRIYDAGDLVKFAPTAVTWEQEPETLRVWIRQRTRWARGNNYLISKYAKTIFRRKPRAMAFEIFNLLSLYYLFIFAVIFSDLIFVLSLFGFVHIRIPGPFAELWALAFLLFVLEVLIALSFEKEDRPGSFLHIVLAYTIYTKLWAFVVLKGFYADVIARSDRVWDKTERFAAGPPEMIVDRNQAPPPAET